MEITIPLGAPDGSPSTTATQLHLAPGLWLIDSDGTRKPHAIHVRKPSACTVVLREVTWVKAHRVDPDNLKKGEALRVVKALDVDTSARTARGLRAAIERHLEGSP